MSGHTKKEIAAIVDLKERQVQFFTEQGVVVPGVDRGEGRGKTRRYSEYNVVQFRVIRSLVEFGITVHKIREVVEYMNHPSLMDYYNTANKDDLDLFLMVFRTGEGHLGARWMRPNRSDRHLYTVLDSDDVRQTEEILVINLGRLDGRGRPLTESENRERMEEGLKKTLKNLKKTCK